MYIAVANLLLLLVLLVGVVVDTKTNLYVVIPIGNVFKHTIVSQLESVSRMHCLHKCKMARGKCTDIIYQLSGEGFCLLLQGPGIAHDVAQPRVANEVAEAFVHFGISGENGRRVNIGMITSFTNTDFLNMGYDFHRINLQL